MTCYNCHTCGRYRHISQLGELELTFKLKRLKTKSSIWLCKWCMTRFGIKYKVDDGWVEIEK
jgi:uncharacterized protein YlaI